MQSGDGQQMGGAGLAKVVPHFRRELAAETQQQRLGQGRVGLRQRRLDFFGQYPSQAEHPPLPG